MPNTYLDTNIYILGILQIDRDCSDILNRLSVGSVHTVVQSDYLFDEVIHWFRNKKGKDWVGRVRGFMITLPNRAFVHRYEWSVLVEKWKHHVMHDDDLPHICSYFAGECKCFVTANRRLTRSRVKEHVNFCSPKEFLAKYLLKQD